MGDFRRFNPVQRGLLINGIASLLLTLAGFGSAWFGYAGYPPLAHRIVWGLFSVVLFGYWIAVMAMATVAMRRGERGDWRRTRNILETGTFLGVNGVTVLFMPYGTAALQHATLLFSTSYCAATILSSADSDFNTRWRILIVMGGLAAVCVIERPPLWPFLTGYLVILTAVLVTFHALIQRTFASLREARAEAEIVRDARTRFIEAATHDLGQPLQAARLFHEQALRAGTPERRRAAADGARGAFEAMERLLHAMLDHLRLAGERIEANTERIAIAPLLIRLAAQYAAAAQARGIDLSALPSPGFVTADPHLCERVLGNFVDNAIRHSQATRVRIGARRLHGGGWRMFVADDGNGLGEGPSAALYEDYAQGAERGEGGFGLGLASASRAARAMGGSIGDEARWRKGAQFFLEIPGVA
jgi:signal transduction histidine kinase